MPDTISAIQISVDGLDKVKWAFEDYKTHKIFSKNDTWESTNENAILFDTLSDVKSFAKEHNFVIDFTNYCEIIPSIALKLLWDRLMTSGEFDWKKLTPKEQLEIIDGWFKRTYDKDAIEQSIKLSML